MNAQQHNILAGQVTSTIQRACSNGWTIKCTLEMIKDHANENQASTSDLIGAMVDSLSQCHNGLSREAVNLISKILVKVSTQ